MNRRELLALGAGVTTLAGMARGANPLNGPTSGQDEPQAKLAPLSDVNAYNYVLGTQSIGATHQFTQESLMVETARAILGMGSNLLKMTMGRGYQRMMLKPSKAAYPETMQYLLNQGSDARDTLRIKFPGASIQAPPAHPGIQSLTDLARLEPSYRRVFAMPFAYYVIR